ncbi:MAG: SURF1 family protein [Gemmatimonadales bacterium]
MSSFDDTRLSSGRKSLFLLTVLVALGCSALGMWQLGRLFDRRARNRVALAEREQPPIDLNRMGLTGPTSYRPATVEGSYDADREILLRGRVYRGTPGIQVVTPLLRPGTDTAVLVNRGFVPTPDAGAPPTREYFREPGPQRVTGIAISVPDDGDGQPLQTPAGETWHRLDLSALRARLPYPIAPYYVLAAPEPGSVEHTIDGRVFPMRADPPALDDGPHLSYAVQWFLIGGSALGFGILFVLRRTGRQDLVD